MRMKSLAILALGAALALPTATSALAQQQSEPNRSGGLSGAIDKLNRAVNPDEYRDNRDRQQRQGDRYERNDQQQYDRSGREQYDRSAQYGRNRDTHYDRDAQDNRGMSGSSMRSGDRRPGDRTVGSGSYSRDGDRDLRDERSSATRDQRALGDETNRREMSR